MFDLEEAAAKVLQMPGVVAGEDLVTCYAGKGGVGGSGCVVVLAFPVAGATEKQTSPHQN